MTAWRERATTGYGIRLRWNRKTASQALARRRCARAIHAPVIGERTGTAEIGAGHDYGFALDAAHGVDEGRSYCALPFGQRDGGERDSLCATGWGNDDVGAEAAELDAHFALDIGVDGEQRGGQGGGHGEGGEGQGEAAFTELDGAEDEVPEHQAAPRIKNPVGGRPILAAAGFLPALAA